jgi:hypothetical protein
LPLIVQACRLPRFLPRLSEDGKENGGQHRYDGDDDEELDEGEAAITVVTHMMLLS